MEIGEARYTSEWIVRPRERDTDDAISINSDRRSHSEKVSAMRNGDSWFD